MADGDAGESKTEQPSERRLQKAREEGSVVRAHGVTAAAILMIGAATLSLGGGKLVELLELSLHRGLSIEPDGVREPARLLAAAGRVAAPGLEIVMPFLILMAVVGFAADVIIGGWTFSTHPLNPDFSRIDPAKGFGRLFSRDALVEVIKALIK